MPGQPITRIAEIQGLHLAVTTDLGQDGCRSDSRHLTVALDHRCAGHVQLRAPIAIDECQPRRDTQSINRTLHGEHRGVKDIQLIDLFDLGSGNAPRHRLCADLVEQRFTTGFAQLFRVVEAFDRTRRIEDHCGGHYRTTQRPAPDLVDAGNQLFDQIEIESELHQRTPTRRNTASAA